MYSCYLRVWCWGGGRGGAQFVICCNALHWTERPIDLENKQDIYELCIIFNNFFSQFSSGRGR